MPTHVSIGDRTFLKNHDEFADVQRESFLGFQKSVVVLCDDGTVAAYCGDDASEQVVDIVTGKDGKGVVVEVPTDVKILGPAILTEVGIEPLEQKALFQKFMVMSKEDRRAKMAAWISAKDDPANKATFLSELLSLLDDDSPFIQKQSEKLLNHLDQTQRDTMLIQLNSITTHDQRRDLILEYTEIRNDKYKTEQFVQKLYLMLLDNDTYLRMEFKRFGSKYFKNNMAQLDSKLDGFFAGRSQAYRDNVVTVWRQHHMYNSRRGPSYVRNQLRSF